MKPPDIGAKLLARFSSVGTENITLVKHAGWEEQDGTYTEIIDPAAEADFVDADNKALMGPFFWGPLPPNMDMDADITGDEMRDAKWLWCMVPVSRGTTGDPPEARGPDRVRDNLTGKTYRVRSVTDVHRSQSGLWGALCILAE